MRDTPEYKKPKLAFLKEHKCVEENCYNYSHPGFILCVGHLHGFPNRMHPDDIELLKEDEASESNTRKQRAH